MKRHNNVYEGSGNIIKMSETEEKNKKSQKILGGFMRKIHEYDRLRGLHLIQHL